MKSIALTLSLLFATVAQADTLCGDYRVYSSDGLAQVLRPVLEVSEGEHTPAFKTIDIIAGGKDFKEVDLRSRILNKLESGKRYCLTGEVTKGPNGERTFLNLDRAEELVLVIPDP